MERIVEELMEPYALVQISTGSAEISAKISNLNSSRYKLLISNGIIRSDWYRPRNRPSLYSRYIGESVENKVKESGFEFFEFKWIKPKSDNLKP